MARTYRKAYQAAWIDNLDEDQQKLLREWKNLTRGVPTHKVVQAMNSITPGIEWNGCTKTMMARAFCGAPGNYPFSAETRELFPEKLSAILARYSRSAPKRPFPEPLSLSDKLAVLEATLAPTKPRRPKMALDSLHQVRQTLEWVADKLLWTVTSNDWGCCLLYRHREQLVGQTDEPFILLFSQGKAEWPLTVNLCQPWDQTTLQETRVALTIEDFDKILGDFLMQKETVAWLKEKSHHDFGGG